MAAAAEIVRQGKRDLHVLGWNSGIEFDLLVGAGCVKSRREPRNTAGISGFGLAKNYPPGGGVRVRSRSAKHPRSRRSTCSGPGPPGWPSSPCSVLAGTDVPATNPRIATVTDPFTGRPCAAVAAVRPDVAIIHAHTADRHGNVQLDDLHWPDNDADTFVGWSGKTTIVTVEQLVSDEAVRARPERTDTCPGMP